MLEDVAFDLHPARPQQGLPTLDLPALDLPTRDLPTLELKVEPGDALFGPRGPEGSAPSLEKDYAPLGETPPGVKPERRVILESDEVEARRHAESSGRPFRRYGGGALLVAGLCGLAWAGGAYQALGHAPAAVQTAALAPPLGPAVTRPSAEHDELVTNVRQMAEELRALRARVDQKESMPDVAQKDQPAPAQPATRAALADLTGRLDSLDAKMTTKLAQIDQQLTTIGQQQVPASHPTRVARARLPAKRAKRHDAFDPSSDPTAIGAPRPLGLR